MMELCNLLNVGTLYTHYAPIQLNGPDNIQEISLNIANRKIIHEKTLNYGTSSVSIIYHSSRQISFTSHLFIKKPAQAERICSALDILPALHKLTARCTPLKFKILDMPPKSLVRVPLPMLVNGNNTLQMITIIVRPPQLKPINQFAEFIQDIDLKNNEISTLNCVYSSLNAKYSNSYSDYNTLYFKKPANEREMKTIVGSLLFYAITNKADILVDDGYGLLDMRDNGKQCVFVYSHIMRCLDSCFCSNVASLESVVKNLKSLVLSFPFINLDNTVGDMLQYRLRIDRSE
jgi:hypothetical protein